MARRAPTFDSIDIVKLFVDAVHEEIACGNIRRDHKSGQGYQRDPYIRQKWITQRAAKFDNMLLRPLEVSKRDDRRYAIIDGGGRWLMAQKVKRHAVDCRVHVGLTREQEAELFYKFDREIYRLRSVDVYLAALAAGHPVVTDIHAAISPPYRVSTNRGASNFDGVGALYDIFFAKGAPLIRRTAIVVANTWGGLQRDGSFTGSRVTGSQFGAVALVLDTCPKIEPALRQVLSGARMSPAKLTAKVEERLKGAKATTIERLALMAAFIAKAANGASEGVRVDVNELRTSDLLEAFARREGAKLPFSTADSPREDRKLQRVAA